MKKLLCLIFVIVLVGCSLSMSKQFHMVTLWKYDDTLLIKHTLHHKEDAIPPEIEGHYFSTWNKTYSYIPKARNIWAWYSDGNTRSIGRSTGKLLNPLDFMLELLLFRLDNHYSIRGMRYI